MADLGPPTSGILPLVAPDIYGQELANQRRRAFAQMLLQGQDESNRPWSGLKNAGNSILGAYLLRKSDENDLAIARQYQQIMLGGGQSSRQPQSPMTPQRPLGGGMSGMADQLNAPPQQGPIQGAVPQRQPAQSGGGGTILDQFVPDIPGGARMSPIQKMMIMNDPQKSVEYFKSLLAAGAPTDAMKQVAAGLPGGYNDPQFSQIMAETTAKSLQTLVGVGAGIVGPNKDLQFAMPNRLNLTPQQTTPGGPVGLTLPANSAAAIAQSNYAGGIGKSATTPAPFVVGGHSVPASAAQAAGLGGAASALGVPQAPLPTGAEPAPPLGAASGANVMATGLAQSNVDLRNAAAAVPTNINVLHHIINLSRITQTGSPEWVQEMRATAAGLSQVLGHNVSGESQAALLPEIKKYMEQYALRTAAVQPGTSTDSARAQAAEAVTHADMFPATIQKVAPWLLANESAILAKANALDQMVGTTPDAQKQADFEKFWRNNYRPEVSQFELMSPAQKQGYLMDKKAFPTKESLQNFYTKYKALRPFFAAGQ